MKKCICEQKRQEMEELILLIEERAVYEAGNTMYQMELHVPQFYLRVSKSANKWDGFEKKV
jgi:lipoate-protein ligase B